MEGQLCVRRECVWHFHLCAGMGLVVCHSVLICVVWTLPIDTNTVIYLRGPFRMLLVSYSCYCVSQQWWADLMKKRASGRNCLLRLYSSRLWRWMLHLCALYLVWSCMRCRVLVWCWYESANVLNYKQLSGFWIQQVLSMVLLAYMRCVCKRQAYKWWACR